ncbi:MAG TPA: TetR family transcriptional regulator [Gordonia sp. (in: high G+C Gram-positive bacteria)]|uniref:TetR/AcrR family transcriptional regulator n=1 Tax=unclassified Gordonia (in: high G+C Gram-positive bacteria) TaxID=2657482 RepID=UPI000F982CB9|nr:MULTISPECIES: TetR/AcrR family transcriptional regulator [unclassified Gordonia (in: high G+C Gram-positive bacteria)]RUP39868.1 MAG: TetR family transcriptional regulator [Gordonia sp. (in: high G+C Gram-positive bacteria)]HNP56718.1 TetR family transcriptional regulator [Gordonia sp. (in: high G+C Gram-positive bacteria)]HRC51651.1 TetR family transcriptional regulator [Gordonia sp. (in: high G+C Gram-positive bacteria)]
MDASPLRKRRSTQQVKSLITDAAYEEFAKTGLAGTSVRTIAQRAGVTESAVFRHFPTKPALFEAAAVAPVVDFIRDYAASIATTVDEEPFDVTLRFISGLYDIFDANDRILISLASVSAAADDGAQEPAPDSTPPLERCVDALLAGVMDYIVLSETSATEDLRTSVRLAMALVMGTVLGSRGLLAPSDDIETTKRTLARFVLLGSGFRQEG